MIEVKYADIVTPELLEGAIENREFDGFLMDYHVVHALVKKYSPKRFCEIGCNMGRGTKIIKNALGEGEMFSLDLPTEEAHKSLQHPIREGHGDRVGSLCDLPFTLLRGDSMTFDFSHIFPIDGWYCDGEHSYKNVYHETKEMLKSNPIVIIYHDSDLPEVYNAIVDGFRESSGYELYRVVDTRVAFAIKIEHK